MTIPNDLKELIPFVVKILGEPAKEVSNLVTDQLKFIRFKNQGRIILRAEKFYKDNQIKPKEIPLTSFFPLIESASLEENENIQNIWSNLLINACNPNNNNFLNGYIDILKQLLPDEIFILDTFYKFLLNKVKKEIPNIIENSHVFDNYMCFKSYNFNEFLEIVLDNKMEKDRLKIYLDNLVRLNIIKEQGIEDIITRLSDLEATILIGSKYPSGIRPYENKYNISILGLNFIKNCKEPKID
ncbi:MAG: DUF4393 domain-containing protein [Fusobacteriaceae bacterium]|nr:DUF4393 domain-containing protein [Fusobacteriaceae bacterium]